MKSPIYFIIGLMCGIALILSCDDESPSDSDASVTCDCPLTEAPIPPRIQEISDVVTVPPPNLPLEDGRETVSINCPLGSIVLHAGCSLNDGQTVNAVLEQSYPGGRGWLCGWRNTGTEPAQGKIIVRCLNPS